MKKLLFLLVFAWVAISDSGGQTPTKIPINKLDMGWNKADFGLGVNLSTRFRPPLPGFVSPLFMNSGDVEYDSLGVTKKVFITYTPGTGLVLNGRTFSLKQAPTGSLGSIGYDELMVFNPVVLTTIGTNPVMFLDLTDNKIKPGRLDNNLVAYGEFVPVPLNEDAPGRPGDYSFDADWFYRYIKINSYTWKWKRVKTDESKWNNSTSSGVSPPTNYNVIYNATSKNIDQNWSSTQHPLAWEIYESRGDSSNWVLISNTLEGTLRSYTYQNPLPNTRYWFKIRAIRSEGRSDFVTANVLTPPAQVETNWLPAYALSATTTTNSATLTYSTQDDLGNATFWMARSNISENVSSGWTQVGTTTGHGVAGVYTKTFSGISGTTPIYYRIQRNGSGKTASTYVKGGPYYLQGVNQLTKPTLSAANNNNVASLTAGGPDNVQYFWRSRIGTGSWTDWVAFPGTSKTTSGGTLQAGNSYSFQIYYSSAGAHSPESDIVSLTVNKVYQTPVISIRHEPKDSERFYFVVDINNHANVRMPFQTWYAAPGATDFVLNSTGGTEGITTGVVNVSFPLTSPTMMNGARWKIRSVEGNGFGPFSNEVTYINPESGGGSENGNSGGTIVEPLRITVSPVAGFPTQRLITIQNPAPGNRLYNWAVYENGTTGYVTHQWDVPSNTGSFVVDLAGKLTASRQYTFWVADKANTAANMQGSTNFTYTTQDVSTAPRILVFGNSILKHPPAPELSWPHDWGMAATEESKDFFHQFKMRVQLVQPGAFLDWYHLNSFETGYWNNYDYEAFKYRCNFDGGYDVIVFRLGDNVDDSQVTARNLQARYSQLIDKAREVRANTKFIISTSFWDKGAYNNVVRSLVQTKSTAQSPVVLADLSYMIGKSEYMAYSDAPAASPEIVKQHPGNAGHQGIAEQLFDAYKNLYSTGNPSQITNLEPFVETKNEPWGWTVYMSRPGLKVGIGINPAKTGFHKAGAIVFVSPGDGTAPNAINNYDQGRQMQPSYYAGPDPFLPAGYQKNPAWAGFPWNPVLAGDAYGNVSEVIEYQAPSQYNNWTMYFKTRPKDWALNFYPSECFIEGWYSFKTNKMFEVKYKITTFRTDGVVSSGRFAEAPAVWFNRNYSDIYATKDGMPLGADPVLLNGEMVPDGDTKLAAEGVKTVTYYQKEQYSAIINPVLNRGVGIIGKSYIGLNANRNFLQSKLSHFGFPPSDMNADLTMHGSASYWTTAQEYKLYGNSTGEYSFYLTFDTVQGIKQSYQQYGQAPWTSGPASN